MEDHLERIVKTRVEKKITKAFKIFFAIIAAIVFVFLFGYVIMWLWNWLMPDIFGLTQITYWQAVGILALAKILFGSFGGHHSGSKSKSRKSWKSRNCQSSKNDFSEWKYYDSYWKEEGENAYSEYVDRKKREEQ